MPRPRALRPTTTPAGTMRHHRDHHRRRRPLADHGLLQGSIRGAWQSVASPASFPSPAQASHTVLFYAHERPERAERYPDRLREYRHRRAGHHARAACRPAAPSGWITTSQSVTLHPDATLSPGVAATYYTVDRRRPAALRRRTLPVGGNGSHPVTYWSVDNAGNIEGHTLGYVNIDTTAPVTTASGLQTRPQPAGARPARCRHPDSQRQRVGHERRPRRPTTVGGAVPSPYTALHGLR